MKGIVFFSFAAAGLLAVGRPASELAFTRPDRRWLWGGFGFHNSEATMTPLMSDEFRDQRVLKTYREISPSYARVFSGFGLDVRYNRHSSDPEHVYYRVYANGRQIASTVATSLRVTDGALRHTVTSVDRWGNEGAGTCRD